MIGRGARPSASVATRLAHYARKAELYWDGYIQSPAKDAGLKGCFDIYPIYFGKYAGINARGMVMQPAHAQVGRQLLATFNKLAPMQISALTLLAALLALPAHGMEIQTCDNQVILSGKVEGNEYRRVKEILAQNPAINTAVLRNSPGGDADTGYHVGALFREKGMATYLSGYCRSSCSRFFLGGKERYFTDDYAAGLTYVAFHGNYRTDGELVANAPWRLKQFIEQHSDGKADKELVDRWVNLQNRNGFAYFYHPQALNRKDALSILLCQGSETGKRWTECEKIARHDALSMGIVTNLERKRSCDAATLQDGSASGR